MTFRSSRVSRIVLFPLAVAVAMCGGGDKPTAPSSPVPTPTPAPEPTPTPVVTNCARLGLGPGTGVGCPRQSPTFLNEVDEAIAKLIREKPHIFRGQQVTSIGQFVVGLIDNLEEAGLCADYDGEELQVKNNNEYNDQYDVLTADFLYRRGEITYRSTCYPAAFPTPSPPPIGIPAGCRLQPSREKACGREEASYLAEVDAAIQKTIDEHPEYFDVRDVRGGPNWVRILNGSAYYAAVIANLAARGLCAHYDGFEIAVKRENEKSDQYDIWAFEGYTRRGSGSYRATCYPAAF